jgi:predicted Zn-dependent protease
VRFHRISSLFLLVLTAISPTENHLYPPAQSRLTCAKLFLELSAHVPALEILQRLENEDDEDPEVWYLSGWAWWLLGEERGEAASTDEEESREECWSEAKLCLQNYLTVRLSLSLLSS